MTKSHPNRCTECGGRLRAGFPPLLIEVDGTRTILENVPGLSCESCGHVYRELEDVLVAKSVARIQALGLYPNDLPAALLLYAPSGGHTAPPVGGKTVFQKALWYLSQAMKSVRSFPRPHFIPMQGGPWDPNLDGRIARMERAGLLTKIPKVSPTGASVFGYALSRRGATELGKIWGDLPRNVTEGVAAVKGRVNPLTAQQAIELVHREFPEMWDKSKLERWGVTETGGDPTST